MQDQIDELTQQLRGLETRTARLEGREAPATTTVPLASSVPSRAAVPAAPAHAEPTPAAHWRTPSGPGLEELFGGRVLAWLGGVAILLGIVFFLGMAIQRGWIDESTRTVLATLGSSLLLVAGVWLFEKKGQTEAALAAVAVGLSGLFGTLIVATQVYDLVPSGLGLALAGIVGIVAVAVAVRWDSPIVAGIGIGGALLAPVLVGAGTSDLSLAFMAIALVAAVAVLIWRKWNWLALGTFLVSAPQLLAWISDDYHHHLYLTLAVLAAFWVLYLVAAIGYELRARTADALPVASWLLLLGNVVLIAATGYLVLHDSGYKDAAVAWLLGLAAAHIVLGALALRQPISRELGSLLIAGGLGLSALGFAQALSGPALVCGWAIQAVVLAFVATRATDPSTELGSNSERLLLGSAAFLTLAFGHTLVFEAPPNALIDGVDHLGTSIAALGVSAGAALACGYFWRGVEPTWGSLAELAGSVALVYLASVAIIDTVGVTGSGDTRQVGQFWLSAFWGVTGIAGLIYGLARRDKRFRLAGLALLGLTIAKVFTYDLSELDEMARVASFIAVGLLLLVGAFAYQRVQIKIKEDQA